MTLALLAAAASVTAGAPTRLNPVALFLHADIVVQIVMGALVLASVWVWMIIVSFSLRMAGAQRRSNRYEQGFWEARDIDAYHKDNGKGDVPAARVVSAALGEWRRSTAGKNVDREGTRQRLSVAMDSAVAAETDRLSGRLNFLATVGSVAPFVGLFGTVWGIMDSFFNIGAQANSSLAVVAPGISEALFATAIGLVAAIPSVIAYNRFSNAVNRFEARLFRFADRFHATLSRELEQ
ncbi:MULTISPECIES: protein TolQ [unclassified Novosphingobium]|uniref:protein TolQ n=1 Tax=Novosphingobium TaxID=165696 RepID=UPI0014472B4F|nr:MULTISPECIES: protein TolQ [unclassified Novosphingobium]NKJ41131.1 biopolymer transport protein TolQ [Novosphingobium sp. SG720]NMN03380.1 biopolymer transport protein TolQ [Novosphingobium sp. SG919]NMN86630.1 biopolymer transport protein TolQ [Novosphingobium sp. SG916]